jgi:uroporphyrinogen decarboxylase
MQSLTQSSLLLQALGKQPVHRPPVWMMRQAGRYMKAYRQIKEKYPSFRMRSENPDISTEISLQPWKAFRPDGVILFSGILTPLPGIGIQFDIVEGKGPIIESPIRTQAQVDRLKEFDPQSTLPFIQTILTNLRQEVNREAAILGFVGAPWTLAAYVVEGKSSKDYTIIKQMAFSNPKLLHQLLQKLAIMCADYACYQIDSGAQVIQLFDSWAGQLSPTDYSTFALPYQQQVVKIIKSFHPDIPLILYINGCGGLIERMADSGVDVVSIDWTIDMADACQRLGPNITIQGNVDPAILFGSKRVIRDRIHETIHSAGNQNIILNLGHGVLPKTPEDNVSFFFEVAKEFTTTPLSVNLLACD